MPANPWEFSDQTVRTYTLMLFEMPFRVKETRWTELSWSADVADTKRPFSLTFKTVFWKLEPNAIWVRVCGATRE
jgi:hypothetical protein